MLIYIAIMIIGIIMIIKIIYTGAQADNMKNYKMLVPSYMRYFIYRYATGQ